MIQSASDIPDEIDASLDEVTAAKLALLRLTHEREEGEQTPPLISQHPLAAVGVAIAAGFLIGGVPIARKLLLGVGGFAGRNVLMRLLRGR